MRSLGQQVDPDVRITGKARAVVVTEARLTRTPDGRFWTEGGPAYRFWTRYLSEFRVVQVIARVNDAETAAVGAELVDGPHVTVWRLPHYTGFGGFVRHRRAIIRSLRAATRDDDVVILRIPSPIGSLLAAELDRKGGVYAVEVVGDPAAVLARGVIDHPLRPVLRRMATRQQRRQCQRAIGAAYVTEGVLQGKYPAGPGTVVATYSSVELPSEAFVGRPRSSFRLESPVLVSVGALERPYKGIDTLIEALGLLAQDGPTPSLVHVGDGRLRADLEALAERCGVGGKVAFLGTLPSGAAVREQLDRADLMVMPSRTEGLPRALIEAMARGLPAIGTSVGGIPELLPPDFLVPPDDPAALADRIRDLVADPRRMADASRLNLMRSRDFVAPTLQKRRNAWYRAVADNLRPRPTRVCHVIGSLDRGGAETVALDLCRALPASEMPQVMVTLAGREGNLATDFRQAGATVRQCPLMPYRSFALRLWKTLRQERPDAVVSHVGLASGVILSVARSAGVRIRIARLHSEGDGRPDTLRRRWQRSLSRVLIRRNATAVMGVTSAALRFAGRAATPHSHAVLPNGVDLGRLGEHDPATTRRDFGLPTPATVIVHIGRNAPEKNRPFLIDLHQAMLSTDPTTVMVIAGPGGHRDVLDACPKTADDPAVLLMDEIRDIGRLLAVADVLVLPSIREGLPGVVLEALASGTPVLATDLPGLREIADRVEGLHLLPLGVGADRWARAVAALAALPRERRVKIRESFASSPFLLSHTAKAWRRLLTSNGRSR